MPSTPIEAHAVHSRRLLEHAAEMIAQGDRIQASEKIWGAAAHRLKEIAQERAWPNDSHADGFAIVQHISDQIGEQEISDLFAIASDTHQNFYEDRYELDVLNGRFQAITRLVTLLDNAHLAMPQDLPMPDAPHYRRRHS